MVGQYHHLRTGLVSELCTCHENRHKWISFESPIDTKLRSHSERSVLDTLQLHCDCCRPLLLTDTPVKDRAAIYPPRPDAAASFAAKGVAPAFRAGRQGPVMEIHLLELIRLLKSIGVQD